MNFRNKRIFSLFLSLMLVFGIFLAPMSTYAEEAETVELTIVHLNDVHGRLSPDEREGGIGFGRIKTKVDELKEANSNLLLVNAGDTLHGDIDINLTDGEAMVKMMNLMGFDIMVPGNHDFNYGYERLLELKDMANFPIVGANIVKEADGSSDLKPYEIFEFDGVKVGVFGLGTAETKFKSHPKNTEGIKFEDEIEVSKKMVEELKKEGADVIIALAHLGVKGTSGITSKELAEKVEGIDLIIDGHSHEELNEEIGDTLLVQAGSYNKNIGVVNIKIEDGEITDKKASLITYEEAMALEPDAEIEAAIKKLEELNKPKKETVVGKTKVNLDGEREDVRTKETNLGNLITDAMLASVENGDIAFANGGGIRASIPAGDITLGHVTTSFPFTNTIAAIEVTGQELVDALEHGVDLYPDQAGHFPHVSGMTYKFNVEKPVGERIEEVIIKAEPVDLEKTYVLVTNDFMASGGDGYTMFEGKPFVAEAGLLSDALADYLKTVGEVEPVVEGRIVIEGELPQLEPEPEPTPAPEVAAASYTVEAGDVLWKIAAKFNTTWEKLAEHNKLKNPHLIFPGQKILIPVN